MTDWQILDLAPALALPAGLPLQVAVPRGIDTANVSPADLIGFAERFADENPDHPLAPEARRLAAKQSHALAVQHALMERRWDAAIAAAERVLSIDPSDAPARLNRAAARRETGAVRGALADLDAVAAVFGGVALYHRNRAWVLEDLGHVSGALDEYREALELVPGDPAVIERLRALGAITTVSGPEGPIEVDREQLADLVRRDLAMHDDDHAHLAGAALSLLAEGQPDLAATAAALALAVMPEDEATRLLLVEALVEADRMAEAIVEVDRHVAAEPASALGHEFRAVALSRLGRGDEAVGAAARALALDPAAPRAGQILAAGG